MGIYSNAAWLSNNLIIREVLETFLFNTFRNKGIHIKKILMQ